jgi:hypothetical protein
MRCRLLALLVLAQLTAAAAGQRPQPDERQPPGKDQPSAQATTREGTVVRIDGNKLVLRTREAKGAEAAEERTYTLTPNARVAEGGRVLAPSALTAGLRVRVTRTGAEDLVNRVEVLAEKR